MNAEAQHFSKAWKICKCTHMQDFHFPLKSHYSISHSEAQNCSVCVHLQIYSINHSGALHRSVCGQACKICKCTHTQDFHFPLKAHYSISHSGARRCSACAQAHAWLNAHHTQNHQSCKRVFFKMMKYRIHQRNSLTVLKRKKEKRGTSPPSLLGHQEMSPSALRMMLHGHPHLAGKYNKSH